MIRSRADWGANAPLLVDGTSSEEVRTIACDILDKVFYFLHDILGDLGVMGSVGCVGAVRGNGYIEYHTLVSS